MNVFLTGANGFIGLHIAHALRLAGHRVRCSVREHGGGHKRDDAHARDALKMFEIVAVDFARMRNAIEWLPHLRDIDVVINAAGIFQEREGSTFAVVHDETPRALFAACVIANIKRVVQISALGAHLNADTEFLRSKARADEFLLQQKNSCALVLQPSLVFGIGGASANLFALLAALPIVVLPDGGTQKIQPVHIEDVCTAVLRFVDTAPPFACGRVAAVGPRATSVREYIAALRATSGEAPNAVVALSGVKFEKLARVLPLPWLQPDTLRMLRRGNHADAGVFAALLQRAPRAPETFGAEIRAMRRERVFRAAIASLRWSMALLWCVTGIVSLGIFSRAESVDLLARAGIPSPLRLPLLYGAATLDLLIGIAIVFTRRVWLWQMQALIVIGYSVVIAWKLPEFWLHPFAPMLKNIPLLAGIYLLMQADIDASHRENKRLR